MEWQIFISGITNNHYLEDFRPTNLSIASKLNSRFLTSCESVQDKRLFQGSWGMAIDNPVRTPS
jgi:hypothetical protein